jgi:uncharacterized membrane protein
MNEDEPMTEKIERWRNGCALGLACFYGLAGVLHIMLPKPFLSITPEWVPLPGLVVIVTGLCEIAGAIGMLIAPLRRLAGLGLAIYAICVFPANVEHALGTLSGDPSILQWLYHICRLPLQPVIVWIALFAGKLVTWPAGPKR